MCDWERLNLIPVAVEIGGVLSRIWKFDKQFCGFKGLLRTKFCKLLQSDASVSLIINRFQAAACHVWMQFFLGFLSALVDAIPPSTPAGSAADTLRHQLALLWSVSWRCGQDSCGPTGQDENHLPRQV